MCIAATTIRIHDGTGGIMISLSAHTVPSPLILETNELFILYLCKFFLKKECHLVENGIIQPFKTGFFHLS